MQIDPDSLAVTLVVLLSTRRSVGQRDNLVADQIRFISQREDLLVVNEKICWTTRKSRCKLVRFNNETHTQCGNWGLDAS